MVQLPKPAQILVQWFPSGLFGGLAVHSAMAGNIRDALISTSIAAAGSLWASFSKGFMEKMNEGLNERGGNTAERLLIATDTLPGKLKWKLSGFLGKYYNSLIDSHCELKTEGFNVGFPLLDLEDVFVPLRVAQEISRNVPGGVVRQHAVTLQGEGETQQLWDFLRKSQKTRSYRRIAVLAPPGSGKTTLLQHITLIYALKKHGKYNAPKRIPVLMRMRDVRQSLVQSEPPDLPQLIQERVKKLGRTLEVMMDLLRCSGSDGTPPMPHCPDCDAARTVKNGHIHTGKQRYLCRNGGRQFVKNPTNKVIETPTRELIDRLLLERIPMAGMARAVQVSEQWLPDYVNCKAAQTPRQVAVSPKKKDG